MTTVTKETEAPPQARARIPVRRIIIILVILAVLAAAASFGYNYYINSQLYVSTDDALIDSNLVAVASPSSGTLAIWRVQPGDVVRAGQIIGSVEPPPGQGSSYVDVKAPVSGTILRVDGKAGEVVATAQAMAYVANLSQLTVTAFIDETDISRVKPGQAVDVTVDAAKGAVYHGTVREILPAAASQFALIPSSDRSTGNFTKVTQRIEVHVDLGDTSSYPLYPGENA